MRLLLTIVLALGVGCGALQPVTLAPPPTPPPAPTPLPPEPPAPEPPPVVDPSAPEAPDGVVVGATVAEVSAAFGYEPTYIPPSNPGEDTLMGWRVAGGFWMVAFGPDGRATSVAWARVVGGSR